MNKQTKIKDDVVVSRGIEWLTRVLPDGRRQWGYTWNVAAGCMHECQWEMPSGDIATCYAKEVALGIANRMYQNGFEFDYWHPERLNEPETEKNPERIFIDSMGDLFGAWMVGEHIEAILDECAKCDWHTFLSLTKNAPKLRKYIHKFPSNLQVGVSSPPDWWMGKKLTQEQKESYLHVALKVLSDVAAERPDFVTWMSFEPLSFDYSEMVKQYPNALRWSVIGAASHRKTYYQPNREHVEKLLNVLDEFQVPVFFKGNLVWSNWREEYPN